MTSINKLTQNTELFPDDLLVIWDYDNERTRSISADTIKEYTDSNGVNAKAFVGGKIENNILLTNWVESLVAINRLLADAHTSAPEKKESFSWKT